MNKKIIVELPQDEDGNSHFCDVWWVDITDEKIHICVSLPKGYKIEKEITDIYG